MNDTLAQRSLASVWHPCTQMKLHEAAAPIAKHPKNRHADIII